MAAEIEALPGETIAAALAAADIVAVRQARSGAPRGPFCGMGVCFDCLVDGRWSTQSARLPDQGRRPAWRSRSAPVAPPQAPRAGRRRRGDRLRRAGGRRGTGRPVGGARLALAGADVIVVDERLHAGGQYFKPLAPRSSRAPPTLDRQFRDGAVLRRVGAAGRRARSSARPRCGLPSRRPRWRPSSPAARRCSGPSAWCWRPAPTSSRLPVPGWTLPGVMTVGGLQTLARVLSRGAGPAHRHRRQRPAQLADRARAARRRRQRRGRRSRRPSGRSFSSLPRAGAAAIGRSAAAARGCVAHGPPCRQAALAPSGDASPGRAIACAWSRRAIFSIGGRHRGARATASPRRRNWRARWAARIASWRAAAARWRR